jgi:hypothetical protein
VGCSIDFRLTFLKILSIQMEALVQKMLDEQNGVPIKTVKSFLSKVPSVFTGQDLVAWIMKNELLQIGDLGMHYCLSFQYELN